MDAATLTGFAAGRKRLRASFGRFAYLYVILVIGIPVILFFVFLTPIYWWWVENVDGPVLAREFGFRLEHRDLALPSGASRPSMVVTAVAPGGRFERAPELAAELVRLDVDVIFAVPAVLAKAAQQAVQNANKTTPIVFGPSLTP